MKRAQKLNFNPSCTTRASCAVTTLPNVLDAIEVVPKRIEVGVVDCFEHFAAEFQPGRFPG
jgi:hypothetical protein